MKLLELRLLLLVILSSVLMGLALPNEILHYGNPFIGAICLVPYFTAVLLSPTRRFAVRMGALFGVTLSLFTNFWLAFFHGFSVWTVSGVAIGMGLYFMLFTPFFYTFSRLSPRYRPFAFAVMWTVYEYIKSIGFLAFPWGLIAYPVGGVLPLVQIADITGVWGVSFMMALLNATIAETVFRGFRLETLRSRLHDFMVRPATGAAERPHSAAPTGLTLFLRGARAFRFDLAAGWSFVVLLFAGALVYGFVRMGRPIPVIDHLKVVLVQQNVNSWLAGPATERKMLLEGERLSEAGLKALGGKADLIVWSEESLLRPYRYFKTFYEHEPPSQPLTTFLKRVDTPVLLGAPYVLNLSQQEFLNASILLDPNGKLVNYYGKRRLVPFAEYIPFWNVPAVRHFMENVVGVEGVWTPGDRNTIYTLHLPSGGSLRFGTPICFEDSFSGIARDFILGGADLLINLTNTSWSDTVSAETQQFVAARFISVETKRVMIRSTNSGVTSIIGPWGRVLGSLPLFKPDYLATVVPVYDNHKMTAYTLYGDYLPLLFAILLLIVLVYLAGYLPMKPRSGTRPW